jgi:hypothetical protein
MRLPIGVFSRICIITKKACVTQAFFFGGELIGLYPMNAEKAPDARLANPEERGVAALRRNDEGRA